jgi:hypothetical protein
MLPALYYPDVHLIFYDKFKCWKSSTRPHVSRFFEPRYAAAHLRPAAAVAHPQPLRRDGLAPPRHRARRR